MAGARFDMDLSALARIVEGGLDAMAQTEELTASVGEAMVSSTITRFRHSVSPKGETWAPVERGGKPLANKGQLQGSMVYEASPNAVMWGSIAKQAALQHFGGTVKPRIKKFLRFMGRNGPVFAKSVTIKARPFVGISTEDWLEIQNMCHQYLMRAYGRRR